MSCSSTDRRRYVDEQRGEIEWLKDILPKTYARTELDKRRLGNVVDLFSNIQMIEHGDSKDILGCAYEYCLAKFAEQEGKRAGTVGWVKINI